MASWREIERIRKDAAGFRALAARLLQHTPDDVLTEWETRFLHERVAGVHTVEYTNRQAEKLLQIRDDVELLEKVGHGFSVLRLIEACYLARIDLSEDDESWISELKGSGVAAVRRRDATRLLRAARSLGIVEASEAA